MRARDCVALGLGSGSDAAALHLLADFLPKLAESGLIRGGPTIATSGGKCRPSREFTQTAFPLRARAIMVSRCAMVDIQESRCAPTTMG
jgi:hypothetical protein